MTQRDLIEAFNDCIDQLATGQPLDVVLRRYPQDAGRLAEMLAAAGAVHTAVRNLDSESAAARERVRLKVLAALAAAPPAPSPSPFLMPRVRGLLAAAAVVLLVGFVAALILRDRQPDFAVIESLTPPTATPSHTATDTSTPSVTPSPTLTNTVTVSPTVSATASHTVTASPTLTSSPSATQTMTATQTVPPSPSSTATATPNAAGCIPTPPDGWVFYRVQRGDTLARLAAATSTTQDALIVVNCIENPRLLLINTALYLPMLPAPFVAPTLTTMPPSATAFTAPPSTPLPSGGGDDDDDDDHDDDHDDDEPNDD